MIYLLIKAAISGAVIAIASEIARRSPALGALVVSLPLVSILTMIWPWRDTADPARVADHASATFWLVLPTLPMFLVMPAMMRAGVQFWGALVSGIALTAVVYLGAVAVLSRMGVTI